MNARIMLLLPLRHLITFNKQFTDFFRDQTEVVNVDHRECVYDSSQLVVRLSDHEPAGWVLLRNGEHTYLLIEIGQEKQEWKTWFAQDSRKVLEHLRQPSVNLAWQSLLPLIRQAHREAHSGKDESPNFTFLEDFITKVYHAAHLLNALNSQIKVPDSRPRRGF